MRRGSWSRGLPWTLTLVGAKVRRRSFAPRRRLLVGGPRRPAPGRRRGAWRVGGSVARELEVARLQSDFVSAVSHEFRTPLTTLRQLSELLERGRVASEKTRETDYAFLRGEVTPAATRRGAPELRAPGAGKAEFRLEALDAANSRGNPQTPSRRRSAPDGHHVRMTVLDGCAVEVDRRSAPWRYGTCSRTPSSTRPGATKCASWSGRTARMLRSRCTTMGSASRPPSRGGSSRDSLADPAHANGNQRHGNRPGDGPRDRARARRRDCGREHARPREHVHDPAAWPRGAQMAAQTEDFTDNDMPIRILIAEDEPAIALVSATT